MNRKKNPLSAVSMVIIAYLYGNSGLPLITITSGKSHWLSLNRFSIFSIFMVSFCKNLILFGCTKISALNHSSPLLVSLSSA